MDEDDALPKSESPRSNYVNWKDLRRGPSGSCRPMQELKGVRAVSLSLEPSQPEKEREIAPSTPGNLVWSERWRDKMPEIQNSYEGQAATYTSAEYRFIPPPIDRLTFEAESPKMTWTVYCMRCKPEWRGEINNFEPDHMSCPGGHAGFAYLMVSAEQGYIKQYLGDLRPDRRRGSPFTYYNQLPD